MNSEDDLDLPGRFYSDFRTGRATTAETIDSSDDLYDSPPPPTRILQSDRLAQILKGRASAPTAAASTSAPPPPASSPPPHRESPSPPPSHSHSPSSREYGQPPPVPRDSPPALFRPRHRAPSPPLPARPLLDRRPAPVPETVARIVLAIDYGTTYTGVAFAKDTGSDDIDMDDIVVLQAWPGQEQLKVPSQYSYSKTPKRLKQFGYDIDDESLILAETKMELEEDRARSQELRTFADILHQFTSLEMDDKLAVQNKVPKHLLKNAEDIVEDYLSKVAEVVCDSILQHWQWTPAMLEQIPIDVIITHPAEWSDKAVNKTYRAIVAAFNTEVFPKIRNFSFVSEPEACAHYTFMAAMKQDHNRFRKRDCFIVVDAGGGTVDLASFQVSEIDAAKKKYHITQVGPVSGYPCGSTFVDRSFDMLLKERLREEDYEKLNNIGPFGKGGHVIRKPDATKVHKQFVDIKHSFTGESTLESPIDLPRGMEVPAGRQGGSKSETLLLSSDDLHEIFSWSIEKIIALAHAQIQVLENDGLKVKALYLSGGYANSPYLYNRITEFATSSDIDVERGDSQCWAAVPRGAVMKGLGLLTELPPPVRSCPRHYGIKLRTFYSPWLNDPEEEQVDPTGMRFAADQMHWFFRKGDVIRPGKEITQTFDCQWDLPLSKYQEHKKTVAKNTKQGILSGGEVYRDIVFVASEEDVAPMKYGEVLKKRDRVVQLKCDLMNIPDSNVKVIENKKPAIKYVKLSVKVEMILDSSSIRVRVVSGGKELQKDQLPHEPEHDD